MKMNSKNKKYSSESLEVESQVEKDVSNDDEDADKFVFGVDYDIRRSSMFATIINTANTIVGAGVLALPATFKGTGYVLGIFLFILGGLATQLGLTLLFCTMNKLGGNQLSYGRVAEVVDRRFLPLVNSLLVAILCFSFSAFYLTVAATYLGDSIKFMAPSSTVEMWYNSRTFLVSVPFFLLVVPFTLTNMFSVLQYTSSIAIAFAFYLGIITAVYSALPIEYACGTFLKDKVSNFNCTGSKCCGIKPDSTDIVCCIGDIAAGKSDFKGIINAIPTIAIAYSCAPQAFNMYNDMINPTKRRINSATITAVAAVILLYSVISICSYLTYGDKISDDILECYPLTAEITIVRLGLAFITSVSYPLLFIPARDSILHIISHSIFLINGRDISANQRTTFYKILFWSLTATMMITNFMIALENIQITVFTAIGGSIASVHLSFTLPGVLYLAILGKEEKTTWLIVGSWFSIAFGLFLCITNITLWIVNGKII